MPACALKFAAASVSPSSCARLKSPRFRLWLSSRPEEAENNTLAVRTYKDGDVGSLSVDEVLTHRDR